MRFLIILAALFPLSALAQEASLISKNIVQQHILPGFQNLGETSTNLHNVAQDDCNASSPRLRQAFGSAFDAWISVSHLRVGPSEVDDRAYALAFWPDSRGATPKVLSTLITSQDPIGQSATDYGDVSIAGRGFYALEFLLYDTTILGTGDELYRCQLIQTVASDIAEIATKIGSEWNEEFADQLLSPSVNGQYRSTDEVKQELFKALSTGLQFTSSARLGRPLGTFDRPRPNRAEVWRSGRSLRHVALSVDALENMALQLADTNPYVTKHLTAAFGRSQDLISDLDDPVFSGVSNPESRLKVEVIQQSIDAVRTIIRDELGPTLGVSAGFNAMDGD